MFDYLPVQSPYPGLRPFEPFEGEIFFGREGHTDRLLEILQRERFLAVIGPSGGGKSSLVRAGLLPALAAGRLGTGSHWRLALLRPGSQPLLALAQALISPHALGPELLPAAPPSPAAGLIAATVEDATFDAALIAAELRQGKEGLARLLAQAQARRLKAAQDRDQAAPPPLNLLILADQFEEVFTYQEAAPDPGEGADFVKLLLAARDRGATLTDAPGAIRLVVALTMRTDFLGNCVAFPDLPEAINRAQYLTPRLKSEEMQAAIIGPARLFGGDVEPGFAAQVIEKIGADSDQLPLLQHALARWWRAAESLNPAEPLVTTALTLSAGSVDSALDRHAEEIFGAMSPAEQTACEWLFRAITAGREGGQAVRRPQRLEAIAAWSGLELETLAAVVQKLAAPEVSFLHYGRELKGTSVIDLSHEALMRQWGRLKGWVAEEAGQAEEFRRWDARLHEYLTNRANLLTRADLARALEWWNPGTDTQQPTAAWAWRYSATGDLEGLSAFLMDSRSAEQREREAERNRLEQAAAEARRQAERERSLAQRAQEAEKRLTETLFESQLTHASLLARSEDYAEARKVLKESTQLDAAIPAERRHARNLLAGHVATMGGQADKVYLADGRPLPALSGGVAVSPDGRTLAAAGERATLVLFDAGSGALLKRLEGHDPKAGNNNLGRVTCITFDPSGQSLFSGAYDGHVIRWAIPSGEKLGDWKATSNSVYGLAIRPDGRQLATGDDSGSITLWSLPEGRELKKLQGHTKAIADSTRSLVYSPDGKRLASASQDRTARIWDVETGTPLQVFEGHERGAKGLDFSPDGNVLATSSGDGRIVLWTVDSGQPLRVLTGHQNIVFGVRFSADGGTLYSASRDNTLRAWDVASGATLRVFQGHEAGLWSVALAPPGQDRSQPWAYTAANDGTLRRWPLLGAAAPATWAWTTDGAAISAAIAPNGRWAVVGMKDGALRRHALPGGEMLAEIKDAHGNQVLRIAFSPDGQKLATGSHDDKAKLWSVQQTPDGQPNLKLLHTIEAHKALVHAVAFSPDGKRLATASYDGQIGLFDVDTGQGRTVKAHDTQVLSIGFDPTGRELVSTGWDYRLLRWDADHLDHPPRELARLQDIPMWASLAPDGQSAAVVGRGSNVTLLDLSRPEAAAQRLVGHENSVMRAINSPDGRQLATVSSDMTLRLWDLSSRRLLFTQRLPAVRPGNKVPLWDFDFRCVAETGECWAMVPLTMGRVVVYRWPYAHFPKDW
jgi:WD40 repeat protein